MAVPRVHRRRSNSSSRTLNLLSVLWCSSDDPAISTVNHLHPACFCDSHCLPLIVRGEFNSPSSNFGNVHPSDVLDMPVDPNEPTYCLCHQVSYGEMIGCDNTDVSFVLWPLLLYI